MSSLEEWDSVVVGGGVMGYSAALALAEMGRRTVLLEQFPSPHTRGSSTGQSRITRVANYGARELNPIMVEALDAWKIIQAEVGKQLFVPAPLICVGQGETMAKMRRAISDFGEKPRMHSASEVLANYGLKVHEGEEVFSDVNAGVLLADQCILALKSLFQARGGVVRDRWPVTSLEPLPPAGTCVLVRGTEGRGLRAARVVVCAGPWTGPIMKSLGLNLPLQPIKVGVYYWRQKDPSLKMASFIAIPRETNGSHVYGLSSLEYPGLFKICAHHGTPCDPDNRDLDDSFPFLEEVRNFVRDRFPNLHPQPAVKEACMYTVTPDEEMILDSVPGLPNVVYGCGFSGTGFKIGPVVGKILAQKVMRGKVDHDIARFAAARFPTSKY